LIAECINKAHSATTHVKVVLENSAGGTNSIGSTFEDLKGIIDLVKGTSPLFWSILIQINLEWEFVSTLVMHLLLVRKDFDIFLMMQDMIYERKRRMRKCGNNSIKS